MAQWQRNYFASRRLNVQIILGPQGFRLVAGLTPPKRLTSVRFTQPLQILQQNKYGLASANTKKGELL